MVHRAQHILIACLLTSSVTSMPAEKSLHFSQEDKDMLENVVRGCSTCVCTMINKQLLLITSKLDLIFSEVSSIDSKVTNITNEFGTGAASLFENINSFLDVISKFTAGNITSLLEKVDSQVEVIDNEINQDISVMSGVDSKTDACCTLTQSKLAAAESTIDSTQSLIFETLSEIDVLDSKVQNADIDTHTTTSLIDAAQSKADACCALTQSNLALIGSKIDSADKNTHEILSKALVVESKVDVLDNNILITGNEIDTVQSKNDLCCTQTQSLLDVIASSITIANIFSASVVLDSKIDNLASDVETTSSVISLIESKTNACCSAKQSSLGVIESVIDDIQANTLFTLSVAEIVESKVDNLEANVLETSSILSSIESKTDACCATTQTSLLTLESKLDVLNEGILQELSIAEVIESKIDILNNDVSIPSSILNLIESKTDVCCDTTQSTLGVIESKIDTLNSDVLEALSAAIIIESKVDNLENDSINTSSVLSVIESKAESCFDVSQSLLGKISSTVDDIDINALMTLSALETLDSKTDECCTEANSKLNIFTSLVDSGSSAVDVLITCSNQNFSGGTISAPGTYCLTTNLSGSGPLITIAASQVTLNLDGHTLTPSGDAIAFDATATRTGVTVTNGFLSGDSSGNGISLPTSTNGYYDIQLSNLDITSFSTGINANNVFTLSIDVTYSYANQTNLTLASCNDTQLEKSMFTGSSSGAGANLNTCDTALIRRCFFDSNSNQGLVVNGSQNIEILSSMFNNNNTTGGNNAPGIQITGGSSNIIIKNCQFCNASSFGAANQKYGIQIGYSNHIAIERCTFNKNTADGAHLQISSDIPSCVDMISCEAQQNSTNGFNLFGTDIVVRSCYAFDNTDDGFLASSPISKLAIIDSVAVQNQTGFHLNEGVGIIKENIAELNQNFGFNDEVGSSSGFNYVANAGVDNGGTPAGSPNDTNYAIAGTGNSFDGTGPGAAPFFEFSRTATAKSYWDNITTP